MDRRISWCVLGLCFIGLEHLLLANPTGGQVAAGSAGIKGEGTSAVTVKQGSNLAIINWQTFSIASGESTTFIQPSASSAALNRVLGGQTSTIDGTLKANGSIYLVNGNGIVVGPGGVVSANAFTASTRDIADSDFLAGKLEFIGSNSAGVQNLGKISALGGDVVLIGKTVSNSGTINAPRGTAGLVAGDDVLLGQKNGDGSTITVSPDLMATSASTQVGVSNSGKITAAAAELKAANGNIYALAIQNSGTVRATTVRRQGGHIWLTSDTGSLVNSGTLDASATATRGQGGTVTMKNTGGTTTDSGTILAKGGQGGAGGNAEVSGKSVQFTGTVNLTAPDGATGDLLIDPATLEIVASGGTGTIGSLPATGDSTIDASSLVSALNGANITLNANNSISVNAAVNASGNGSAGNLALDAPTLDFNAAVTLRAGSTLSGNATTVNVGAAGQVQNGVDAAAAGATVNLAAATYDLSSQVVINKSLTVQGSTTGSSILDGQNVTREMEIDGTSSGISVNLNNLTFTDGNAGGDGAGTPAIGSGIGGGRVQDGGGLLISTEGALHANVTINNSTIYDNVSPGGNGGGGIYIATNGGGVATVTVNDSTISDNTADGSNGGGIVNDGYGGTATLTITDSTIANNTTTGNGGGIFNEGSNSNGAMLSVNNSTISGNSSNSGGGGIFNDGAPATLVISDTILAGNMASVTDTDLENNAGTLTDHGYNLFDQGGGYVGNGTTDIEFNGNIDTLLAPLGNYGGPTETMALVTGSPAYLAGGARGSVTTDQRGDTRGSVISIGAWDYDPTQFTAANSTIVNTASDAVGDIIGGTTVSLRDALFYSNVGAVINPTITFNTNPANGTNFSTAQTIALQQGELVIDKSITVDGSTTGSTIVNGQNQSREMEIDGTSSGDTVTLNNLTLTDGNADAITSGLGSSRTNDGGGLLIFSQSALHATVTINNSTISNNTADGNHGGGGIYIAAQSGFATVAINDSTVSGNSAYGTQGGGGIYNDGFANAVTALTITDSTIVNNTTTMDGTGGYGGAIYNEGAGGNSGSATVTVINSTLSGNSASNAGGGIYNDDAPATLTIGDTILAANTVNGTESDVSNYNGGTVTDHGYNLFGQNGSTGGFTGNGTTDIELAGGIDTALAPLGNYGGPTETMALVAGSPAYLAGGARGSVTTDQRGDTRGSVISIGAWDYNPTQFTAANSTIVNTASDAVGDIIGGTTVSLRDALFYSNVGAVSDPTITFNTNPANGTDFSASQTIALTQGELLIDKSVTVDGSTTGSTSVSGQNATREMEIDGTSSGDTVSLNNLTLTDGNASSNTTGLGSDRVGDGGGLLVYTENSRHATVTINDSTISNNSAPGGNGGGGVYVATSGGGVAALTINDSTISGNEAMANVGGGIYLDGYGGTATTTITNSTIANNASGGNGGGIYNEGPAGDSAVLTITDSTISGNSSSTGSGGLYNNDSTATVVIGDTILAGNTKAGAESDFTNNGGTVTDHGYNLYGQSGNTGGFTGNGTTDILLAGSLNTALAPLGNYGGPTETMALVAGSPAYLAGGARGSVTTDQRGVARGSTISIGAWDYNPTQFTAANSTIVNTASDALGDVIGGTTVSLRDALFYSNAGAVTDPTITFNTNPSNGTDFSTAQTIDLVQGELVINQSVTVQGSTTAATILDGQNATRDIEIDGNTSGITVTLNDLTLTDGNAVNTGGIGANRAGDGGGLLVYTENSRHATVNINDSTISNNTAPNTNGGGGIYIAAETGFGTVNIDNSTISGNTATLNFGGGIYSDSYQGAAALTIANTTIVNNTAYGNGGGIFVDGRNNTGASLTISNSTIAGNSSSNGGGIYNLGVGAIMIGDTILSGNTVSGAESDLTTGGGGSTTDNGYNLYGQNGNNGGFNASNAVTIQSTDILLSGAISTVLAPLANNGGPTETMALVAGSPALGNGSSTLSISGYTLPGTDQRGDPRQTGPAGTQVVDIGAYQDQGVSVTASVLASGTQTYGSGGNVTVTLTPTAGQDLGTVTLTDVTDNDTVTSALTRQSNGTYTANLTVAGDFDAGNLSTIVSAYGHYAQSPANTLTVNPAPLTITANDQTKVYGAALPTLTASFTGFVNGDTTASLTTDPTLSTTATSASSVAGSPYAITASGAVDSNYTISYIAGSLDVTVAPLTITADNQTKVYGAALPTLTASYTGFVNGDTTASLTTDPTLSTTATSASSVAGSPYAITASGAVDSNYTISYVAGTLDVTAAPLTITANDQTKVYGAALPTLTASYTGLVNGDTSASLTIDPTFSTTATSASSVAGSPYTITASGAVDSNYTVSYVAGTLDVTAAPLTITANDQTKVYGAALPTLTASYTGLVNGDTSASLTTGPTLTTTATSASSVAGSLYAIAASGAADSNYDISYVAGALDVTAAPLTITANNQTKVYGAALPTLTASYTGFVNGDTSASLTTDPTLTTTATAASSVAGSPYAITVSGAADTNYTISYVAGSLDINPATLQYGANSTAIQLGQAIPPLTGTVTGFVNGDSLTSGATTGALTFSTPATGTVPGNYAINGSGLSAANYIFVQAPGNAMALSIGGFQTGQPILPGGSPNPVINFASQFDANANYETLFTQSWFPLFEAGWDESLVPVFSPVNVLHSVYSERPARYTGVVRFPRKVIAFGSSFQYLPQGGNH
jgi:filamentous hemagglutinin family protein